MKSISEDLLQEIYQASNDLVKCTLRKEYPFLCREAVIYKFKDHRGEKGIHNKTETFYFSIGDRVQIWDGSYHAFPGGEKINESLGLSNPTGTVVYNRSKEWYNTIHGNCTLNLVIKLDDGRTILSAPNCVHHLT
jgi:hypothetical protein